jgi:hypothetical protein
MPFSSLTKTNLNVHRVIITSLMVAAKFFDDFYFNNAFYARVGGISVLEVFKVYINPHAQNLAHDPCKPQNNAPASHIFDIFVCSYICVGWDVFLLTRLVSFVPFEQLNELEVDFLRRLGYSLRVTPAEFDRYHYELLLHAESPDESSSGGSYVQAHDAASAAPGAAAAAAAAAAASAAAASAAAHPYGGGDGGPAATPNYSGQTLRPNVALPAVSHALGALPLHPRHSGGPPVDAAAAAAAAAAAGGVPATSGAVPWPGTVPWPSTISSAVAAVTAVTIAAQRSTGL